MGNVQKKYIIIAEPILYDSTLTPFAKILYGEIVGLAVKDGFCYANNNHFAKLYQCSRENVSRRISELVKNGYIQIEIENHTKRKIFVKGCDLKVTGGVTEKSQGCDLKVTQNNTINNTLNNKKKKINIVKCGYGIYNNVFLSSKELETLQAEFPNDWQEWINKVSSYCQSTGKKYKDFVATIRNWAGKENPKPQNPDLEKSKKREQEKQEFEKLKERVRKRFEEQGLTPTNIEFTLACYKEMQKKETDKT